MRAYNVALFFESGMSFAFAVPVREGEAKRFLERYSGKAKVLFTDPSFPAVAELKRRNIKAVR